METLLGTAKKLGVNFFQYIRDRVSGAKQMSSLAVRIEEKARSLDLGSFVQFRGAPGLADRIPVQG